MTKRLLLILNMLLFISCGVVWGQDYHIEGIQGNLLTNVQKRLATAQDYLKSEAPEAEEKSAYLNVPEQIRKGLEPFGYFRASVQVLPGFPPTYVVSLNSPLRITSIEVKIIGPGRNLQPFTELREHFALKVDDVLNMRRYNNAKHSFYAVAQNTGFLNGKLITHRITIDLKSYTARIELVFDTGPRFYFGNMHFSPSPFAQSFLQRFAPFQPGFPYNTTQLLGLQRNLSSTIYFQQVGVTAPTNHISGGEVPVFVKLTPRKAHQYSLGAGYGTDTGLRGTLGWEWRHLTPTGHYFQFLSQLSQQQSNNALQARYVIPGANPVTDHYYVTAGLLSNHPANSRYTNESLGVSYITTVNYWQRTFAAQLEQEKFEVNENPNQKTLNFIPDTEWEYIRADNRINTNDGYRLYLKGEGGLKIFATSTNFLLGEVQGKWIKTFMPIHTRMLLRVDGGGAWVKDLTLFPASQRFYAGGSVSVRGYDYQTLGPGTHMLVASAELQPRLYKKIYAAIFYDTGNAIETGPFHLFSGVGGGFVYRSGVGSMELTVAKPVNVPGLDIKSYKIQFSMGPDL